MAIAKSFVAKYTPSPRTNYYKQMRQPRGKARRGGNKGALFLAKFRNGGAVEYWQTLGYFVGYAVLSAVTFGHPKNIDTLFIVK